MSPANAQMLEQFFLHKRLCILQIQYLSSMDPVWFAWIPLLDVRVLADDSILMFAPLCLFELWLSTKNNPNNSRSASYMHHRLRTQNLNYLCILPKVFPSILTDSFELCTEKLRDWDWETLVRKVVGDIMKEITLGQTYESRRKRQTWQEEQSKQSKRGNRLETRPKHKWICRRPLETSQSEDGLYGFGKEGQENLFLAQT